MPDDLKIIIDSQPTMEALALKYALSTREVQQIGTSAINRSLTSIRVRVVKRLQAELNMKPTDIKKSVDITKAFYDRMQGEVSVERDPIPLISFIGPQQTKAGVSVLVRKTEGRQIMQGTFIQTMPNGHIGIFERLNHLPTKGPNVGKVDFVKDAANRIYRKVGRFAIGERAGLTLTGYLSHAPAVVAEETTAARDILGKNLLSQLSRRLAQRK